MGRYVSTGKEWVTGRVKVENCGGALGSNICKVGIAVASLEGDDIAGGWGGTGEKNMDIRSQFRRFMAKLVVSFHCCCSKTEWGHGAKELE